MFRLLRRLVLVVLLGALVAGAAYVQCEGFSHKWRAFVMEQFEKHGIYLTLEKLTLDPLEGLVAQKIHVFQDPEHKIHLASVDRLDLDIDYAKLLHREAFIESVELRNASVSLAIDPLDKKSEKLELSELNARVFIIGDHIDIRKAEGRLFGLRVSIVGALVRPPTAPKTPEEEEQERLRSEKRLAAIRARRGAIEQAAKLLKHFESARAPMLSIHVDGDLSQPEKIKASLHLTAGGMRHGTYVCEELEADATYADESIDLSRLFLKDHLGELEASASYQIGAPSVDFHLHSGVDLPAIASAVLEEDSVREVVFYEPVDVRADGQYMLDLSDDPDPFVPVQCTGKLRTGRLTTRGEVIDGLTMNFGLSPQGCYVRDLVLRHKTGTLGLQAMWHRQEGLRYRGLIRMDPHVFLPFVQDQNVRDIIERFEFREQSSIYIQVEGEGSTPDIAQGQNHGHAELHSFKYRNVEISGIEADVDFHDPTHTYHHVRIDRPEGRATAEEVAVNEDHHTVKLTGVVSDCDPVALMTCFAPDLSDKISVYRFDHIPHIETEGLIQLEHPGTKMRVKFRADGVAHYVLWGDDYVVKRPAGELLFDGPQLSYDVSGSLFGKDMTCKGMTSLEDNVDDYTVHFRGGLFPYSVFGKVLPFQDVRAEVNCRKGLASFDVKSALMDGTMALKGTIDDHKKPEPFQGELRYDALSFKKFTHIYSPGDDTEGDLTGHFEFSGKLGDWKTLKGTGAIVVLNSNLYAVPILGPLTPLLGAVLPRPIKNFNLAKEADATFSVADGFAVTNDLVALTGVFRIVVDGKIDFLEDRIKLYAKAKFRGLPGLVLFPVSQILEYVGEGSISKPVWRPRYFSGSTDKSNFRKPDEPSRVAEPPLRIPRAEPAEENSTDKPQPKSQLSLPVGPPRTAR